MPSKNNTHARIQVAMGTFLRKGQIWKQQSFSCIVYNHNYVFDVIHVLALPFEKSKRMKLIMFLQIKILALFSYSLINNLKRKKRKA